MPRRASTLETVEIYIEILRRIPRHQKITIKELHEQLAEAGFQRDKRTIERHLKELCTHFGIECDDRSKPYGFRWMKDAKGSLLPMLSEQESLLLTLAEDYLRNILPSSLIKSMESFFNQARYELNTEDPTHKNRQWLDKVKVVSETQPLIAPTVDPEVFDAVSNALYNNRLLQVEYQNLKGWTSSATVMPLGLAQQGARLYLVCRYEGFNNERSLALHRIQTAKTSTLTFERPAEFSLAKYDDDGRFGYGEGKKVRLVFKIKKPFGNHLLETKLSENQEVTEVDGWLEVAATVVDTAQLTWWLRGFGTNAVIISKEALNSAHDKE